MTYPAEDLARLERLATRMDSLFTVPGTRLRIGLDSILGLVPGIGDALTSAPALYIIAKAHQMGVPTGKKLRMGANVGIDFLIGSIPLIGDIFDVGYKGNLRNVALIRSHLEAQHGPLTSAGVRASERSHLPSSDASG